MVARGKADGSRWRQFIGDRAFYKMVFAIALPIMLQNGITNLVSLLDNVMVGGLGTDEISGVAIANQLNMVFYLAIFGAVSGAGIFGAQFFGSKDSEGFRYTFRYKLWICLGLTLLGIGVFYFWGKELISLYLVEGEVGDIVRTLECGESYLQIMLIGMLPYSIVQIYASSLRETGKTVLPMTAGIIAVIVNCCLNYILIFGHFGAPRLEADGAAIATVVSRFTEMLIVVGWTHWKKKDNPYIQQVYRSMRIPVGLVLKISITGFPLLLNETLWAAGQAVLNQQYAQRGIEVVSSMNISATLYNLFSIFFMAMGSVIAILVGQQLGEGDLQKAKSTAVKLITTSVSICILISLLLLSTAGLYPQLYKTEPLVKELAKRFLTVAALAMPLQAFLHASYFTIRSGGKTLITFLFDSVYVWTISIPLSYALVHFTDLYCVTVYGIVIFSDIIKCVIGFVMVKKGIWLNNIVKD